MNVICGSLMLLWLGVLVNLREKNQPEIAAACLSIPLRNQNRPTYGLLI